MAKKDPYITVNKLGEYLVATERKKRSILHGLKYPKEEGGSWGWVHGEARTAIKNYFEQEFNEQIILDCLKVHEDRQGTDNQKRTDSSSILLLRSVLDTDPVVYDSFSYTIFNDKKAQKMIIKGVTVSVYPDLIVESTSRGKDNIGLMTLHLGTTSEMNEEGGKYISSVLHRYATENLDTSKVIRTDHCISYDVNSGNMIECPKNITNRWHNIEAGCMNIAAIWDSI